MKKIFSEILCTDFILQLYRVEMEHLCVLKLHTQLESP